MPNDLLPTYANANHGRETGPGRSWFGRLGRLYGISTWDERTRLDWLATKLYGGIVVSARTLIVLLAAGILLLQFVLAAWPWWATPVGRRVRPPFRRSRVRARGLHLVRGRHDVGPLPLLVGTFLPRRPVRHVRGDIQHGDETDCPGFRSSGRLSTSISSSPRRRRRSNCSPYDCSPIGATSSTPSSTVPSTARWPDWGSQLSRTPSTSAKACSRHRTPI